MAYVLVTTGLLVLVLSRVATRMITIRAEAPPDAPQGDEVQPEGMTRSGDDGDSTSR